MAMCTVRAVPRQPHAHGPSVCRHAYVRVTVPARCLRAPGAGRVRCVRAAAQIGLVVTSVTGHTAEYADIIKEKMGDKVTEPLDAGEISMSDLSGYSGFIVGAPTWHTGADTARSGTAWDDVLDEVKKLPLKDKPCAVFGCGDSSGYGDYFCDAMDEVYTAFEAAGCKMIGHVSSADYDFADSKSLRADGTEMCGLALDYDNEDEKTDGRIDAWVKQLAEQGL
eukprot:363665-Chlamydomonas_euryale.AAC.11